MKGLWQKAAILLLGIALVAAVLFGRKGTEGGKKEGKAEEGQLHVGEQSDGKGGDGGGTQSGMHAGDLAKNRVARDGKLLTGWEKKPCIVVDPGHGGYDPGKIGSGDVLEKDVNLAVALLLRDYLEASGVKVVMTREKDESLCEDGQDNMKVRDLKRRIQIIEEADPVAVVSVHQNSYPEGYVHGAQVFYYVTSKEGKSLAEALQNRLIREADPENDRQVKDNNSYFLLKKTAVPLVIAECGFLSNEEEKAKLCTPEYQEEIAWALYLGVMDYLEQKGNQGS